jgi:pimeloyl-ACP methyl ester carboxylesterase
MSLHCKVDDFLMPWQVATPVFMVHGFSRNATIWNRWMPQVTDAHRAYRLDLRGCGKSDVPPLDYVVDRQTVFSDLLAVLDSLGLERVHYVGESSSGLFGTLFALAHPERIASLTLCETPTRMTEQLTTTYAVGAPSTPDAMRELGMVEWCRRTLGYRIDLRHASPEMAEWYVQTLGATPVHVAAAMFSCWAGIDLAPVLDQIKMPVLLVSGGDSPTAPIKEQERMQREIPDARYLMIPGFAHGIHVLQPEACAAAAVAFWKEIA